MTVITMKTLSILTVMVLWSVGGGWVGIGIVGRRISLIVTIITTATIVRSYAISKRCRILAKHA